MFRIKFLVLCITCHLLKHISTSSIYMIDTVNVLTLPTNVIEIVQLPNSSIIIEYSNLTFVMYTSQFQYLSQFIISNSTVTQQLSSDTNNHILMGISNTAQYLCSKPLDQFAYSYQNASQHVFYHISTKSLKATLIKIISSEIQVYYISNSTITLKQTRTISSMRSSTTKFVKCIKRQIDLLIGIICLTNINQIIRFDFTINITVGISAAIISSIYNHTSTITKILYENNFIVFQDSSNTISVYDLINKKLCSVSSVMQNTGKLSSVAFLNYQYYFLIFPNLYRLYLNASSKTFMLKATVQSDLSVLSPTGSYSKAKLTKNSGKNMLSFVYQNNTNTLFSFKQCQGNSQYNFSAGLCEPYNCSVANCIVCNFAPNICTTCNTSFSAQVINKLYECIYLSCNIPNCQQCLNLTYCSICVTGQIVNSTGKCAIENITDNTTNSNNTTMNSSVNSTANSTSNSTTNSSSNTSTSSNQSYQNLQKPIFNTFSEVLNQTLSSPHISLAVSLPASRRLLKPFVGAFCNFDDLHLYFYHQRKFDEVLQGLFAAARQIQYTKWTLIPIKILWGYFGVDTQNIQHQLDNKKHYTHKKFLFIQENGNGFFLNTLNYFMSNIYLVIGMYLLFRMIFQFLFNKKVSIFFRHFSFTIILPISILQGNIQYMSYLLSFQFKTLFFQYFVDKLLILVVICIGFLLVFMGTGIYWMVRYFCHKQKQLLHQNVTATIKGTFLLGINFGIRNIVLGAAHFFANTNHQKYDFVILIILQLVFLFTTIFFMASSQRSLFRLQFKQWFNITSTLIRILLIATMIFSIESDSKQSTITYFSIINACLCIILITSMIMSVVLEIINFFIQIFKIIMAPDEMINDLKNRDKIKKLALKSWKLKIKKTNLNKSFIINSQNILTQMTQKQKYKTQKDHMHSAVKATKEKKPLKPNLLGQYTKTYSLYA